MFRRTPAAAPTRQLAAAERHDAPWVAARHEQLEADVKRTWGEDPVCLSETKGTREVHGEGEAVN